MQVCTKVPGLTADENIHTTLALLALSSYSSSQVLSTHVCGSSLGHEVLLKNVRTTLATDNLSNIPMPFWLHLDYTTTFTKQNIVFIAEETHCTATLKNLSSTFLCGTQKEPFYSAQPLGIQRQSLQGLKAEEKRRFIIHLCFLAISISVWSRRRMKLEKRPQ